MDDAINLYVPPELKMRIPRLDRNLWLWIPRALVQTPPPVSPASVSSLAQCAHVIARLRIAYLLVSVRTQASHICARSPVVFIRKNLHFLNVFCWFSCVLWLFHTAVISGSLWRMRCYRTCTDDTDVQHAH